MASLDNDLFHQLLKKWKHIPSLEIPQSYIHVADRLLYADEELVRKVINILVENITAWAIKNSKVYENRTSFIEKKELLNKDSWFVKEFPFNTQKMSTSGSTTGVPFQYLRWDDLLRRIEGDNHYDLVLNEFNIPEKPEIMSFFSHANEIYVSNDSANFMDHHGFSRQSNTHYIGMKELCRKNQEAFYNKVIEHILEHKLDVLFLAGPQTNSLCYYLKKNKINAKLATLLSNTNEKLLASDARFLLQNKFVDYICDHMRCWDGGATFFTCKHYTYHLCDNLSYCTEIDKKLISTDYFSFPSPFVNYWNGDYCEIGDTYKRCECGRLYREFKFLENRPFAVKGVVISEVKKKIEEIGIKTIKQVKCTVYSIEIVSVEPIHQAQQKQIQDSFNIQFKFSVEPK